MAKTYSCVVVGAGGITRAWFPWLKELNIDIRGVVDLDVEKAREKIDLHEVDAEASTDLRGMLKSKQPDFVVDLTVPEAHCEVTCTALRAGCHVIGEKPMAASMDEARRMVKASEESGKLYMVSQSRRYTPRNEVLQKIISRGKIGELTTLNADFYMGCHFGGFRDEMDSPLLLDMSIHHFDLARYFSQKNPRSVYAREFNPRGSWYAGDVAASCIFEMDDGVIFTYRGSWCAEGMHTSWHGDWRVIGDKGTVVYERDQTPAGQCVSGGEGFHRPLKEIAPPKETMKYTGQHGALREMLTYFRTGKTPQGECHDNIKSLAMVFAAVESSRKDKRIEIKD